MELLKILELEASKLTKESNHHTVQRHSLQEMKPEHNTPTLYQIIIRKYHLPSKHLLNYLKKVKKVGKGKIHKMVRQRPY